MLGYKQKRRCSYNSNCCHRFSKLLLAAVIGLAAFDVAIAKTMGLVVTGIGGNPEYAEQFEQQGKVVIEALRTIGESDEDFSLLQAEDATRSAVLAELESLAAQSADAFYLVLLGHGTVDAETWRFNLPGEDITTEDLVSGLSVVNAAEQLVLVATSASGALLDVLSQPGRHVVTATKSGGELNAVRFPEYLAEAMETAVADTDRNEILTLAEVYRYTNEQTQKYYEDQKLLASEHARLVSEQPDRLALARLGSLRSANDDPVVAGLLNQRLALEDEFLAVKAKKSSLPVADYYAELESVLISIALLQQEIDAATGWVNSNE